MEHCIGYVFLKEVKLLCGSIEVDGNEEIRQEDRGNQSKKV